MEKPGFGGVTRWGKVPAWWLLHDKVDADGFCVLAAMATYADEDGFCEPSQATLARRLGRSRPWVNRVVADLAASGLLSKQVRSRANGGTTSCRYQLAMEPTQVEDFRTSDTSRTTVPTMTAGRPAADTGRHRGDRSHLEAEQIQNTPPEAREAVQQSELIVLAEPAIDWQPGQEAVDEARRLCPEADLAFHTARFVRRCRARGYRYARLDDAWLSWLLADSRKPATAHDGYSPKRGGAPAFDQKAARYSAWAVSAESPPRRAWS